MNRLQGLANMGSYSSWGNEEKTIIYRELSSIWTWDEYMASCKKERQMLETVQHSVTLIIDATESLALPVGSLGYFKRALDDCCEQCAKQIIVSRSPLFWTLHRLLIQMMPEANERFLIVRTLEEAYQFAKINRQKPLPF